MADNERAKQGERLKKIRKDLGLDQVSFAEMLGISQSQYSRTERGVFEIPQDSLRIILRLGYNLNWLIGGNGEMNITEKQSRLLQAADLDSPDYLITSKDERLRHLEQFIKSKFADYPDLD